MQQLTPEHSQHSLQSNQHRNPVVPGLDPQEASDAARSSSLVRFLRGGKAPKMQPYHEDEDIEHYLTTSEQIASAYQWALHLAPLLNGTARAAYVAMDVDDNTDCAKNVECNSLQI